jgi:hypothetical protein
MEAKSSLKSSLKRIPLGKDNLRKIKHTCDCCDYTTSKMSNYKKHLKSKKHVKHVKNSGFQKSSPKKPEIETADLQELQEQIKQLAAQLKAQNERPTTNTNCNNTIINNTNTISVNVYLNEDCKNALNIKDFVNQIQVQLEDVIYPSKLIKDNIVSNLFINNLKKLSSEERPVHCVDAKRGKFFVKDKDIWTEIQKKEKLNPLDSQIGMLKLEVYKKSGVFEEEGLLNYNQKQKIREACEISGGATKINNEILKNISNVCSIHEARKKKSLDNID